uniref:Uncharacterized protein n=1 Tax=Triticum urartu TaxID=4572 RepID=A0A8R7P5K3_TRIUA
MYNINYIALNLKPENGLRKRARYIAMRRP